MGRYLLDEDDKAENTHFEDEKWAYFLLSWADGQYRLGKVNVA